MTNLSKSEELNESNRYIGGDDKPINLAQTTGHFRLQLTKVRKFSLADDSNVQLQDEKVKKTTSVAQTKSSTKTKDDDTKDEKNDCAINESGQKVTSHVQ
jgi:hypothetical protein